MSDYDTPIMEKPQETKYEVTKRITKGDMTYELKVRKVSNGYIICEYKYGKESEDGEYIDETKEMISKTNPFDKKDEGEDKMFGFVDTPMFDI